MLVQRDDRWLLTVRGADVDDAPGQLGLVGGHLEHQGDSGPGVLEATARREAAEEVGLDLADAALTYLESEVFTTDAGVGQVTVSFLVAAPEDQEPVVADPAELTALGWWTPGEAAADPRCPPWLPPMLARAELRRRRAPAAPPPAPRPPAADDPAAPGPAAPTAP
ncbi:NUDIX hydrolase [Microlunatus antarcticus]|uniref:NUDIX hydrolase n=1 Tax=Microlunatus antarcticus TaxID=53388 RepID=UPI002FCCCE47